MKHNDSAPLIDQARTLVGRLERISADSIWARRSSGARGALLRWVERFDHESLNAGLSESEQQELNQLLQAGYFYLKRAAQERLRK